MKKAKLLFGLLLAVSTFVAWQRVTSAHDFHSGNNVTLANSTIDHTVFTAGKTITVSSEINGDLFCAGQNVTISGTINGDLICAAQTLTISGTVTGDIRVAAQTVTLSSKVAGSATIAGQTLTMQPSSTIGKDLTIGSETAVVEGTVGRDIALGGTNATIGAAIERDIKGYIENLTLTDTARVKGNITYTSNNELQRKQNAVVGGTISKQAPPENTPKRGALFAFTFAWFVYWLFAMLLIGLALVIAVPQKLRSTTQTAFPKPWKALLVGAVAHIVVPIAAIASALTVVGLPLALLLLLLWFAAELLSFPFFAFYIGRLVQKDKGGETSTVLIGVSLLTLLYFLPIIGLLAFLATSMVGTGMLLLDARRSPQSAVQPNNKISKSSKKAK